MSVENAPSPQLFFETVTAYQRTAALKAAVDLDLFTIIDEAPASAAAIAARAGAAPRATRMLCDFLTLIGFLRKEGDVYRLTRDSAVFLSTRSPAYMGGTIHFLNHPSIVDNFAELTTVVRSGKISDAGDTVATENPVWVDFARAMVPMALPAAQAIAALLGVERSGPLAVLDLAAGHGMYGITIAQRNPQATVVAVDWPAVLGVASEHAERAGVTARYRTVAGDAFTAEFGEGYDVALVTNFLHHFDRQTCTAFLQKVWRALQPGGRVVVLEMVPNDDRISPPFAAAFVMHMLAGTHSGDAYTFGELRGMMSEAGFGEVSMHQTPSPQSVLIGVKAAAAAEPAA